LALLQQEGLVKMTMTRRIIGCGAVLLAGVASPAFALEGGGSVYPAGAENYLVGALPRPARII